MIKLFAHVHLCPPDHNAGAEWYLLTALRYLNEHGYECVIGVRKSSVGSYQGVRIVEHGNMQKWWQWADVGLTHLDETSKAAMLARRSRKPIVHLVHNQNTLRMHRIHPRRGVLVVFNSEWVRKVTPWRGGAIVVPPPVWPADYRVRRGRCLTLLNLNDGKGADVFYRLAEAMPGRCFIGVIGVYGKQVVRRLPNVTILSNGANVQDVYRQTRILLMPSDYESWGRVAIEAAASGIPTIANPTPGLQESLGVAGMFARREHIEDWKLMIHALDDPRTYAHHARLARERSAELDPESSLKRLDASIRRLVGRAR